MRIAKADGDGRKPQRGAEPSVPRATRQRQAILAVVHGARDHPTAAEIHRRVRRVLPDIGVATVYRTLARLLSEGEVAQVPGRRRQQRFDGNSERHDHLVCAACQQIIDVQTSWPESAGRSVARRHGFALTGHRVELIGVCKDCRGTTSGSGRKTCRTPSRIPRLSRT